MKVKPISKLTKQENISPHVEKNTSCIPIESNESSAKPISIPQDTHKFKSNIFRREVNLKENITLTDLSLTNSQKFSKEIKCYQREP